MLWEESGACLGTAVPASLPQPQMLLHSEGVLRPGPFTLKRKRKVHRAACIVNPPYRKPLCFEKTEPLLEGRKVILFVFSMAPSTFYRLPST